MSQNNILSIFETKCIYKKILAYIILLRSLKKPKIMDRAEINCDFF